MLFRSIDQRIDKGSDNYGVVVKVINKRIEAEDKIASDLKQLLPEKYDPNDPLTAVFIDELKYEIEQHSAFSKELKSTVYSQANTYYKTMMDKRKDLHSQLKSQIQSLQKSILEKEKAQKELDAQKAKMIGLQGSQAEKQDSKVKKATKELAKRSQNESAAAMKASSTFVPDIHRKFTDFDGARLEKLKKAIAGMANTKAKYNTNINKSIELLNSKMNNYDAKDRSERYVAKVFDTSSGAEIKEDDSDLVATAISDYRSDEPSDLQFVRGDQIHVMVQHHSGWWEGELNGKRGSFPKTFVQLPNESHNSKDPIGAVFLCIKDYEPTRGGDIKLLSGDLVYVDYIAKGKCSGTNLRDKKRGYFPLDNLELRTDRKSVV